MKDLPINIGADNQAAAWAAMLRIYGAIELLFVIFGRIPTSACSCSHALSMLECACAHSTFALMRRV